MRLQGLPSAHLMFRARTCLLKIGHAQKRSYVAQHLKNQTYHRPDAEGTRNELQGGSGPSKYNARCTNNIFPVQACRVSAIQVVLRLSN